MAKRPGKRGWPAALLEILGWLNEPKGARRPAVHRRFRFSTEVLAYVRACSETDKLAFGELVLRLDANPVEHSDAILTTIGPPGMRRARFSDHTVTLRWDPASDSVQLGLCEPADD